MRVAPRPRDPRPPDGNFATSLNTGNGGCRSRSSKVADTAHHRSQPIAASNGTHRPAKAARSMFRWALEVGSLGASADVSRVMRGGSAAFRLKLQYPLRDKLQDLLSPRQFLALELQQQSIPAGLLGLLESFLVLFARFAVPRSLGREARIACRQSPRFAGWPSPRRLPMRLAINGRFDLFLYPRPHFLPQPVQYLLGTDDVRLHS